MVIDPDTELTIPEAAKAYGITPAVLRARIRAGWVKAWPVTEGSIQLRTTLTEVREGSKRMALTPSAPEPEMESETIESIMAAARRRWNQQGRRA